MFSLPSDGSQYALLSFYKGETLVFKDTSFNELISLSSVSDQSSTAEDIYVYPQPTPDEIHFSFNNGLLDLALQLNIYNQSGT